MSVLKASIHVCTYHRRTAGVCSALQQGKDSATVEFVILNAATCWIGNTPMPISDQAGVRSLETADDFGETRLEGIGFVFHGTLPPENGKRAASKAGQNLLHFARCGKLEKVS